MSKNTIKTEEVKAVPFFARFLEEQSAPNSDKAPWTVESFLLIGKRFN